MIDLPGRNVIEADPMFQLNTVLWSTVDTRDGSYIPVLRRHGYFLHSISRRLQVPKVVLHRLGSYGAPSSDLLVDHQSDERILVIECKASSFGPTSSTALQARKLLTAGADLAGSIGRSRPVPSYVLYVTRAEHSDRLVSTLGCLTKELSDSGMKTASVGTAIVEIRNDGVWLSLGPGERAPEPLRQALSNPVRIVVLEESDSPLYLYLIPWDPSVTQDTRLEAFGKALLSARVINRAVPIIARATPPEAVVLSAADLLKQATLGVSAVWRAPEVRKVESFVAWRLYDTLRSAEPVKDDTRPQSVTVTVSSQTDKRSLIDMLVRTDEWTFLRGSEQLEFGLDV